jgi:hypothetical protein
MTTLGGPIDFGAAVAEKMGVPRGGGTMNGPLQPMQIIVEPAVSIASVKTLLHIGQANRINMLKPPHPVALHEVTEDNRQARAV